MISRSRLKRLLVEEFQLALREERAPVEDVDAATKMSVMHVDRSLGYAIADYLKTYLSSKRFRDAVLKRMVDREDIYAPWGRSGLTQDIIKRTSDVVAAETREATEHAVEEIIRALMIEWKTW